MADREWGERARKRGHDGHTAEEAGRITDHSATRARMGNRAGADPKAEPEPQPQPEPVPPKKNLTINPNSKPNEPPKGNTTTANTIKVPPKTPNAQSKADLIIHLISPEVLTRPGDVQREYRLSLDRAKAQPFGSLLVIPLLIGEVVVPREFSHLQYVQYAREDWRYRLCKGIVRKFEQMNIAVVDGLA